MHTVGAHLKTLLITYTNIGLVNDILKIYVRVLSSNGINLFISTMIQILNYLGIKWKVKP